MLRRFNIFESKFEIKEEGYSLSKYTGDERVLFIPAKYNGKKVTSISAGAFKSIISSMIIILDHNVEYIHSESFLGCDGIVIYTPHKEESGLFQDIQNVTIRYGFEEVYIYEGLTLALFNNTEEFAYIFGYDIQSSYSNPVIEIEPVIGGYTVKGFEEFSQANNTQLEGLILPDTIKEIPKACFMNCINLKAVILSNSLLKIDKLAYAWCDHLRSLELPNSVISVASNTFEGNENFVVLNQSENIDNSNGWNKSIYLFNDYFETMIHEDIMYALFNNETAIVLGNQLSKFTDLIIPDNIINNDKEYSVVAIGPNAFKKSYYLRSAHLSSSIKDIYSYAFANSNITKLTFESHVKLYDGFASECLFLEEVILAEGLLELPVNSFFNNISLKNIDIPKSLKVIGNACFYNCYSIKHIDFHESLEHIDNYAFYGTDLNYIEVGKNVKYVGEMAFGHIQSLTTLIITSQMARYRDMFITNENDVNIYLKGNITDDHVLSLLEFIKEDEFLLIDNFVLVHREGLKYLVHELKDVSVVGYIKKELPKEVEIEKSIAGNDVTKYESLLLRDADHIESCVFPSRITSNSKNVFDSCTSLKQVIFRNNVEFEDTEYIVENNEVEIWIEYNDDES